MNDQQRFEYEVQRQEWEEEQNELQPNNVRCKCGNPVHPKRVEAGYYWCMECGETKAKTARLSWCIAPLNKSNYILITDPNDLKGLNPKRTPT
jgi:ribosomal protein L37AE/L43A